MEMAKISYYLTSGALICFLQQHMQCCNFYWIVATSKKFFVNYKILARKMLNTTDC